MSLENKRIVFVGAGNMAGAILRGLVAAGSPADQLTAVDLDEARLETLASDLGVNTATPQTATGQLSSADIVVLAVKPQVIPAVLADIKSAIRADALIMSIAAGVTLGALEKALPANARVIRTMPNTPALVGAAATALCAGKSATPEDMEDAEALFSSVGVTVTVPEKLIDAVTGLSGSGPAYVFLFLEALADGGVRNGLPRDVALRLAAQTVRGAATLMMETGKHPGVLKDQVTSPGGTTIAGVHTLESGGLRGTVIDAVTAATERSKALGKG